MIQSYKYDALLDNMKVVKKAHTFGYQKNKQAALVINFDKNMIAPLTQHTGPENNWRLNSDIVFNRIVAKKKKKKTSKQASKASKEGKQAKQPAQY